MSDNEVTRDEYDAMILSSIKEKAFQAQVRKFLEDRKWLVFVIPDMRLTRAGWPDLFAMHPDQPGRMLAWELKKEDGRRRPAQMVVTALFALMPGIDARFLRPSGWYAVRDALLDGTLWEDRHDTFGQATS